jgi:hypothetical protein
MTAWLANALDRMLSVENVLNVENVLSLDGVLSDARLVISRAVQLR